jgi:hypothetical protein
MTMKRRLVYTEPGSLPIDCPDCAVLHPLHVVHFVLDVMVMMNGPCARTSSGPTAFLTWMCFLQAMEKAMTTAAMKIQTRARGMQERRRVEELKKKGSLPGQPRLMVLEEKKQEDATILIQRRARGLMSRKKVGRDEIPYVSFSENILGPASALAEWET